MLTARDVPGSNAFGIYPVGKDQPVLAAEEVRFRGEAVLLLIGERQSIESIRDEEVPIDWQPLDPVVGLDAALAEGASLVQAEKPGNILTEGLVRKGDLEAGFAAADFVAEGAWETCFVEHAYIEPEAGWARREGDRLTVAVTTQTPYMDRDEIAHILGIEQDQVRLIPTACGGGFGGKLDALGPTCCSASPPGFSTVRSAASTAGPRAMASTTKRHPAELTARSPAATPRVASGRLRDFDGDFNTGAYASWGPTVADRVPIHATGPYVVPNVSNLQPARCTATGRPRAPFAASACRKAPSPTRRSATSWPSAAASIPWSFACATRCARATPTATGQVLESQRRPCRLPGGPEAGLARGACAPPRPNQRRRQALRRGVGLGCMWYGCGNTSLSNPSTMQGRHRPRRKADALQRRGRHRPGRQHHYGPDLRRRPGRTRPTASPTSWATPT